ncbi:unnamed protein product, partial [Phaeothamnion confervicola]
AGGGRREIGNSFSGPSGPSLLNSCCIVFPSCSHSRKSQTYLECHRYLEAFGSSFDRTRTAVREELRGQPRSAKNRHFCLTDISQGRCNLLPSHLLDDCSAVDAVSLFAWQLLSATARTIILTTRLQLPLASPLTRQLSRAGRKSSRCDSVVGCRAEMAAAAAAASAAAAWRGRRRAGLH